MTKIKKYILNQNMKDYSLNSDEQANINGL